MANLYDLLGTGLQNLASNSLNNILSSKNTAPEQSYFNTPSIQQILQPEERPKGSDVILQQLLQNPPQLEMPSTVGKKDLAGKKEKPRTTAEINAEVQREKLKESQNQYALKFLNPYVERSEQSRKDDVNYNLMKQAAQSGNLRTGYKQKLAEAFGVADVGRNFDTQLFEKAAASAVASASKIFPKGTRLNMFLEKIAQRTVPSLYNSPEAIEGIANINLLLNEMTRLEEEEAVKIIEENDGSVPYNINSQLNKRLDPERKRINEDILKAGKTVEDSLEKAEKFQEGNRIKSLPDAQDASFPVGSIIKNTKTGISYEKVSDNGTFAWKES